MIKVIDNQDRGVLGEGRNYQLGFAFVKKLKAKDTFETVMPISPCKDYLNDVVWSEFTGKEGYAYGLHTSKKDTFKGRYAYMVIKICPYFGNNVYPNQQKDEENLKANYKNIEAYLNKIEEKLGLKTKTSITPTEQNGLFLVKFNKYWIGSTYLISMYSLLTRVAQWYDGKKDYIEFLETFTAFSADIYLIKSAIPKIKFILDEKKGNQDLKSYKNTPHSFGILSYNFT